MTKRRKKQPLLPRPPLEEVLSRVDDKLQQARFHLERLKSATRGNDVLEIKSYLGGCLCAAQAALSILREGVAGRAPKKKHDRVFLERMTKERHEDLHVSPTALRQNSAIGRVATQPRRQSFASEGRVAPKRSAKRASASLP
jgi:hypothetical protein